MIRLFALISVAALSAAGAREPQDIVSCAVTMPNDQGAYANDSLLVYLTWPDGTVVFRPGGPGFVLADGALSMKFGWERRVSGELTIQGRRLDGEAPSLRAEVPCCYGATGFQASALIFPSPGCWEVTGTVGTASLTFVTRVVKIDDGPVGRAL